MLTRREMMKSLGIGSAAFGSMMLAGLAAAAETAQTQAAPSLGTGVTMKKLFDYPLEEVKDANAVVVRFDFAPGAASAPHRHPGSAIGYVLSGRVEIQVAPGAVGSYRQGELWYAPPHALHRVSRNLSTTAPASILFFMLVPKGKPFLLPASEPA
ncbi:MAG TPA: cupin domain-containing protein [Candidatus Binataceae bacterium]|nr:cupin domain-containing protein [Candidatus Binataceae bacterium]